MGSVAKITTPLAETLRKQELKQQVFMTPWEAASSKKREVALVRAKAAKMVVDAALSGGFKSCSAAADGLLLLARRNPTAYTPLYVGRNGKLVSRASLLGWVSKYEKSGVEGLLNRNKGSAPKAHPWERRALALYSTAPTAANKPDCGTVAYQLMREGFGDVEPRQVRSVINRYSKGQTDYSKKRVGAHYHQQNLSTHVIRDKSLLPVGHCYMGDGHTCDVHVAHPANGEPWRPELTVWIDWRSNYVVDWYISNAESGTTSLHSLARAFSRHSHVPARLYVDPGSGFKNKLISLGKDSFCERYSINPSFALPGNAKGKGLVEGWFKHFEFKVGKSFLTYCGKEPTSGYLRNLRGKVARGEIVLPSLEEYKEEIIAWVEHYNNTLQKGLGCSPTEMWEQLKRVDPVHEYEQMIRPVTTRKARRGMITLKGRKYEAPALMHFQNQEVKVEYDLTDDQMLVVRDVDGKKICDAHLVERRHAIAPSIIEEENRRRLEGQIKRLHVRKQDAVEKARPVISHRSILESSVLEATNYSLRDSSKEPEELNKESQPINIDIQDLF